MTSTQKVVFITGASSGIGRSIANFLHQSGRYIVYGVSRNIANDVPFKSLSMDVCDEPSIQKAVDCIIDETGRIDVLINNAGVGITGAVEELPLEQIRRNFEVNVFGAIGLIQKVLPFMRKNGGGTIVNITSIAGYMGLPYRGVYCASKSAFDILTESLSMEVKPFGIKVFSIAPGDFKTNIASRRYHEKIDENSPYFESYKRVLKGIDDDVDKGLCPDVMAKKIVKLLETKRPKLHYKVGAFMEKFSIVLKRVLPDRWYEKLIKTYSNI